MVASSSPSSSSSSKKSSSDCRGRFLAPNITQGCTASRNQLLGLWMRSAVISTGSGYWRSGYASVGILSEILIVSVCRVARLLNGLSRGPISSAPFARIAGAAVSGSRAP